jgi:hypothetical protein
VKNNQILKGALVAAVATAPLAVSAEEASWNISGWLNESATYYDDGVSSDVVTGGDNGTTLGSRITISGSTPLANTGLSAGFEVILEPTVLGGNDPLTVGGQQAFENGNDWLSGVSTLGESIYLSGAFGKVTLGTQSMPTDNIAVLADPSLTLWSTISPVFRGNAFQVQGTPAGTVWGSFLTCQAVPGLGIGIDCNGIYRNGVRYDLPAFGPVSIALGYANDDVYDVAVKYSDTIGRLTVNVHGGYSYNADGGIVGAAVNELGTDTWQVQAGLMDSITGLFGTLAYQNEQTDDAAAGTGNDTDAWWVKAGVKRQWMSAGDTAISFNFGQYNDQFGAAFQDGTNGQAADGINDITGSEVQRWGVTVDQYFGSNLIIYGAYQNLSLDVDGTNAYNAAEDLDMFTLGMTYFF